MDHLLTAPRQKWLGVPVEESQGTLPEISALIPRFTRRPFSLNGENGHPSKRNRLLDMIVRESNGTNADALPIGIVSKSYNLVQHSTVLACAVAAMKAAGVDHRNVHANMQMTENGERMALHLHFPECFAVKPKDGHPLGLRLFCINSVDGSLKFFVTLGWFRFVCGNGLIVGAEKSWVKSRHRPNLDVAMIGELLKRDLVSATTDKQRFEQWLSTKIQDGALRRWVDGPLKVAWGVKAATRAYHIAITGNDVELILPFEKALPSTRQVKPTIKVPGSVTDGLNAYAICQVLSWLAKERNELQEHIEREREIEPLIQKLIALN